MEVGKSCAFCGKTDFLPFQCDACSKYYCLEHRSYATHSCETGLSSDWQGKNTFQLITCPKCKRKVRVDNNADLYEVINRHLNDPSACRVIEKCAAAGCKEKLTLTNTFECPKCGKKVCLKHRYEDDHQCTGRNSRPGIVPNVGNAATAGGGGAQRTRNSGRNSNNNNNNFNNYAVNQGSGKSGQQQPGPGTGSSRMAPKPKNDGQNASQKKKKKGFFGLLCGCVGKKKGDSSEGENSPMV